MKKLFLLLVLFIITGSAFSTIRGVPGQYSTIQAAINASVNTDTVLVEPGTYFENINFRGRQIVVTGRYYQTNDPATIYATIINGSSPANPDSASCVRITYMEDSTTVLQGFYITGGKGTKWQDEHGAGRYREGGGILIAHSNPVIQDNIICNNILTVDTAGSGITSRGGGGMRIGDCYPRIYNNVIYGNTGIYGSGVVLNYASCIMKNNMICYNSGATGIYGGGAGIWIDQSFTFPKVFENNTIVNNSGSGNGAFGGVYLSGASNSTFRNNILWGNTGATQFGGATVTAVYCDVQSGHAGAGNLNLDPMFADSNFYLATGSPCIDAGDSSYIYNDPPNPADTTMALYPSKGTRRNDMGAYGGPMRMVLSNQIIGIRRVNSNIPNGFSLNQNYPNPFNPSTLIIYQLPKGGFVSLRLYDITGRQVGILVNSIQQAGTYKYDLNASDLPSGFYFYKLESNGFSGTRKMVLIK